MSRVGFLVDQQFEDSELQVPYEGLKDAGHEPVLIGAEGGKTLTGKKGAKITVERSVADVSPSELDALVVPGGYSPDHLRMNEQMVDLTRKMHDAGKPIAAICHGGWMLAEADLIRGRVVTSWPSIRTDLVNAGAEWVDQEVVEDGNLITSRKPDDLPAFTKTLLSQLEQQS